MSIKFVAQLFSALVLATFLSLSGRGAADSATGESCATSSCAAILRSDRRQRQGQDKSAQATTGQGKVAGTSNDRLFLALPNFLTLENAGNVPPLTTAQKFKVVALGSFDKIEFPWYGISVGHQPGGKQRAWLRSRVGGLCQTLRIGLCGRDHRKLHDQRGSSVNSASGSAIFPIERRWVRTPDRLRGEPNLCYPDRFRRYAIQLL